MKQYFYDSLINAQGSLSLTDILINFLAAAIIAIAIYISYRLSHVSGVYNKKFNISLIMLTLITTLVMNVIGNNIALSLGMVGALSIVRFRTAIKDSRDTAYIFWCIAVGICCGVSEYLIAGIGSFIIFIFLIFFGIIKNDDRVLIVIKTDINAADKVDNAIDSFFKGKEKLKVKNQSIDTGISDMIFEVSGKLLDKKDKDGVLLKSVQEIEGLHTFNVVRQEDDLI